VLTIRGGVHDFVKVLDFGLAKATESAEANLTSANAITGTPLYLSPEAVNAPDKVDATSDVYAIGAVAYFLLTGAPVFTGSTVMEICMKHVQAAPEPPSTRTSQAIATDLEALILKCLSKAQSERPKHAGELLLLLEAIAVEPWTEAAARAWWQTSAPSVEPSKSLAPAETTMAYEVTG
jgi:serine/threonine protein kinase